MDVYLRTQPLLMMIIGHSLTLDVGCGAAIVALYLISFCSRLDDETVFFLSLLGKTSSVLMQAKTVKELHSNFVKFAKCDVDIKYMTLSDLLCLLKKNEVEQSVLELATQRLVLSNVYDCIRGDNGDLQDL